MTYMRNSLPEAPFMLGLKASLDLLQLEDRLKYNPDMIELHTTWEDVFTGNLEIALDLVIASGVREIMIHEPMMNGSGEFLNLVYSDLYNSQVLMNLDPDFKMKSEYKELTEEYHTQIHNDKFEVCDRLSRICRLYNEMYPDVRVRFLVHVGYKGFVPNSTPKMRPYLLTLLENNITDLLYRYDMKDIIVFENGIDHSQVLSYFGEDLRMIIKNQDVPLCLDLTHLFISTHGGQMYLQEVMKDLKPYIKHYHLANSSGQRHDAYEIGTNYGHIDFKSNLDNFNPEATNIYEISLRDYYDCLPMVRSHNYIHNLKYHS